MKTNWMWSREQLRRCLQQHKKQKRRRRRRKGNLTTDDFKIVCICANLSKFVNLHFDSSLNTQCDSKQQQPSKNHSLMNLIRRMIVLQRNSFNWIVDSVNINGAFIRQMIKLQFKKRTTTITITKMCFIRKQQHARQWVQFRTKLSACSAEAPFCL